MIITTPIAHDGGSSCATYASASLYADTAVVNSPDCHWQVISFGNDDPTKSALVHLTPSDIKSGDNAFIVDRSSGRVVYHFSMFHTARVSWLRDRHTLIVNLDPGPGEDGTVLAFPLDSIVDSPIDLGSTVLPDVFRRSHFPRTDTHSFVSYTGTRGGRWLLSVSLEATRSGLPLKESRCYLYSVTPNNPAKLHFIGSRKYCQGG